MPPSIDNKIRTICNKQSLSDDHTFFDHTVKEADKGKYKGLEYLLTIIKLVYSKDIWDYQNPNLDCTNDLLKDLNKIITNYNTYCCSDESAEYSNDRQENTGWIPENLLEVCDPNFKFPDQIRGFETCEPYKLLGIKKIPPKRGTLKVQNKTKEKATRTQNKFKIYQLIQFGIFFNL